MRKCGYPPRYAKNRPLHHWMIYMDSFYSSKPWFKTRSKVLKRDEYRCVLCNDSVYGKGMARIDHYPHSKKDRPDLALDMNNLRTLCAKCDNIQSTARGHRAKENAVEGVDEDGYPDRWKVGGGNRGGGGQVAG